MGLFYYYNFINIIFLIIHLDVCDVFFKSNQ